MRRWTGPGNSSTRKHTFLLGSCSLSPYNHIIPSFASVRLRSPMAGKTASAQYSSLFRSSTYFQQISLFFLWFLLFSQANAQNQSEEVQTLLSFKDSMESSNGHVGLFGDDWIDIGNSGGAWSYWSSWKATSDKRPCDWVGVTCTTRSTVEELDLSGWALSELPSVSLEILSNLTGLRKLDLSSNYLGTGPPYNIPDTIQTLTGLVRLHLARNNFSGPIPPNISACQSLKHLSLENNHLSGEIPNLRGLKDLQVLLLSNNQLTGPFPKGLGEITSLVNIEISNNMLNGTILSLPNLTNLIDLSLHNNNFTEFDGPMFPGVKSLEHLSVQGNQLEGQIPLGIGNLSNLKVLDLSNNKLSGDIPFGFSRALSNSLLLDFSQNQLTGSIPADLLQPQISNYSTLSMNLSHNFLTGNIPIDGTKKYSYLFLDLSYNNLSGPIPVISNNMQIYSLRLRDNFLSGDIVDFLGNSPGLQYLTKLRLPNNLFTGDLSRIVNINNSLRYLRIVDLSNNNLQMSATGATPDLIRTLLDFFAIGGSLKEFRVGGNNFSGTSLPSDFGNYNNLEVLDFSNSHLKGKMLGAAFNSTWLPSLQTLNLSNNDVTGSVPETIVLLPNLVILDVTNNNLSGQLPVMAPNSRLYNRSFFLGNDGLCGAPLDPCPQGLGSSIQWWVLLIIVGGSVIMAVGSCLIATWRWRVYHKRHQQDADLIKTLMERESTTLMPLWELKKATDHFAESARIGEGAFGTVYTGKLNDGTIVAIKRSKHEGSEKNKQQFLNEVRILSQVNHRHLVKLLGCCMENKISLLVLEFISNGTLQQHLLGKIGPTRLTWEQRLNIAVQTADALNYLHSATTFPIYHRDVKSSNILLNDDLDAKVADFGISRLAPIAATHVSTVAVKGTIGYIDPEYYNSCKFTNKSDVYSFGVVLLELISARPAVDLGNEEETSLVNFANTINQSTGDLRRMIDPSLTETYSDPTGHGRESILNVWKLALKCLDMRSKARPSMKDVWKELQNLLLDLEGTSKILDSISEDGRSQSIILYSGLSSDNNSTYSNSDTNVIQMPGGIRKTGGRADSGSTDCD